MNYSLRCKVIVGGRASGRILTTSQPINFLSSVDHLTGMITDKDHELCGEFLKNRVLVFPYTVGSSVGSYTIFALKSNGVSPSGIICTSKTDITTASGCAIANIPLLELYRDQEFPEIKNNDEGIADGISGILRINKF
jgi:uncharacterized protein